MSPCAQQIEEIGYVSYIGSHGQQLRQKDRSRLIFNVRLMMILPKEGTDGTRYAMVQLERARESMEEDRAPLSWPRQERAGTMSLERREQLVEHIVDTQPQLRAFVQNLPHGHDMMSGSWNLLSYSFQRGFEALWDQARADNSGLLLNPLLLLWRQSVELALKAAITDTAGGIDGRPGHNLDALFSQLLEALVTHGIGGDDDLTRSVREMISVVQSVDPLADRFRYPSTRSGKPFEGLAADLDELFQSHWIIVTYCEGAAIEVEEAKRVE